MENEEKDEKDRRLVIACVVMHADLSKGAEVANPDKYADYCFMIADAMIKKAGE
jgi:hypothetical protein